jgi:hypothetical protein
MLDGLSLASVVTNSLGFIYPQISKVRNYLEFIKGSRYTFVITGLCPKQLFLFGIRYSYKGNMTNVLYVGFLLVIIKHRK